VPLAVAVSSCQGKHVKEHHMKRLITIAVMGVIATAFAGCITI
jgi:hypothetical protein